MHNEKAYDIYKLKLKCIDMKLYGYEVLDKYTCWELCKIYNGAGPERWSQSFRDIVTKCIWLLKPSILIHDVMFHESDGTLESFQKANEYFQKNNERLVIERYPLATWKILRHLIQRKRWFARCILVSQAINSDACFKAWEEAKKK